jgi:hypothetical protein
LSCDLVAFNSRYLLLIPSFHRGTPASTVLESSWLRRPACYSGAHRARRTREWVSLTWCKQTFFGDSASMERELPCDTRQVCAQFFWAQREHGEPAQLTSGAWKSSSWNWVRSPWKRRKTRPSCFEARKGLVHRQHAVGSNRLGRTPQRRERAVLEAEKTGLFVSGCPACVGKSPAPSKAGDEPAPATAKTGHKSDRIPLAVHSRDGRVRVIKS